MQIVSCNIFEGHGEGMEVQITVISQLRLQPAISGLFTIIFSEELIRKCKIMNQKFAICGGIWEGVLAKIHAKFISDSIHIAFTNQRTETRLRWMARSGW